MKVEDPVTAVQLLLACSRFLDEERVEARVMSSDASRQDKRLRLGARLDRVSLSGLAREPL